MAHVFAVRDPRGAWKQLAVVRDEQIVWFELVPALLAGWNCRREWSSAAGDWDGYSAEEIVKWKRAAGNFEPANASETEWALRRAENVPAIRVKL